MEAIKLENKKGYKETKLGWIPEDWEVKNLGSLSVIKGQYGINAPAVDYNPDLPAYFRITDISEDGDFDESKKKSVNASDIKQYILEENDIVFARTGGTVGRTYMHKDKNLTLVFAGFLIRFRLDEEQLDPNFLKNYSETYNYWKWVKINSVRSGQPGINGKEYCSLPIPVPLVSEQKAIANCLSTWDRAITKQTQLIKANQLQKKALTQQLLTGKKRLKGFSKEWELQKLNVFFNERKETNQTGLELLSIGEAGVYPQSNSNKKDTSNTNKSKYKRICPGDIGYNTMRMWQGRSALSALEGIVSPAYTIVTPKQNANSQFFAYLFKFQPVIHKFYRNSQGLVSDTLNCKFKDFSIVKVLLPTQIEEQKAIAKILTTADNEINVLQQQLEQFKLQKKGLMQLLLTGKKRLV